MNAKSPVQHPTRKHDDPNPNTTFNAQNPQFQPENAPVSILYRYRMGSKLYINNMKMSSICPLCILLWSFMHLFASFCIFLRRSDKTLTGHKQWQNISNCAPVKRRQRTQMARWPKKYFRNSRRPLMRHTEPDRSIRSPAGNCVICRIRLHRVFSLDIAIWK